MWMFGMYCEECYIGKIPFCSSLSRVISVKWLVTATTHGSRFSVGMGMFSVPLCLQLLCHPTIVLAVGYQEHFPQQRKTYGT
jgi:hypothetical protein